MSGHIRCLRVDKLRIQSFRSQNIYGAGPNLTQNVRFRSFHLYFGFSGNAIRDYYMHYQRNHLSQCVVDISHWMAANRLQMIPAKTELLWADTKHNVSLLGCHVPTLQLGLDIVTPSNSCSFTWNPTGSCFSCLTEFRTSNNSEHPTSSASSISEEADSTNSFSHKVSDSSLRFRH